jgi:integrin alpha FG-GAP repeat containing protein 1
MRTPKRLFRVWLRAPRHTSRRFRRPQRLFILFFLTTLALFASPTTALWSFSLHRFSGNALVPAGPLGLGDGDGRVIAFGNFNGDHWHLCAFFVCWKFQNGGADRSLVWMSPRSPRTSTPSPSTSGATGNRQDTFELSLLLTIRTHNFTFHRSASFCHPQRVYNVVPGDYTHDGKLDVLVMAQGTSTGQLSRFIYPSMLGGGFCELFRLLPRSFSENLDRHESDRTSPFHPSPTHPL